MFTIVTQTSICDLWLVASSLMYVHLWRLSVEYFCLYFFQNALFVLFLIFLLDCEYKVTKS